MRRLGQQIVHLRNRIGISQEQLADSAHLSQSRLNDIEQGLANPTLEVLLRIALSLKAEPWELLALPYGGASAGQAGAGGLHEIH
mgnify:CR=1 FL=1